MLTAVQPALTQQSTLQRQWEHITHSRQHWAHAESSILSGFSRPVSVQAERDLEVQLHNSAVAPVFDGGNNIYDDHDHMFDYQEQCATEGELDYNGS